MTKIDPPKVCGRCGATYDERAWSALEPCGTMGGDDVRGAVASWPEAARITLRRCARCGVVLARLGDRDRDHVRS